MAKAKTRNGTGVAARAAKDLPEDLRRALVSGPMAAPGSGPCGVGLNEIDDMIRILVERREEMEAESFLTQVNQGVLLLNLKEKGYSRNKLKALGIGKSGKKLLQKA